MRLSTTTTLGLGAFLALTGCSSHAEPADSSAASSAPRHPHRCPRLS